MAEDEKREVRTLQLTPEVRLAEDGKKKISGYAVKWEQFSQPLYGIWKEQFRKGAFAESLSQRLTDIFATWQHDVNETIGRSPSTLTVREDDTGLFYEIDPPGWADRYVESIERGDVRNSSFTFIARKVEYDFDSDPDYVLRTVIQADLIEVAPVTLPAYPQSTAGVRAGASADPSVAEEIKRMKEEREDRAKAYAERKQMLRNMIG